MKLKALPELSIDVPPTVAAQVAVLAGGCFWCVEAVYQQVRGVLNVISGYAGGTVETANYRAVCTQCTDHAEAVRITFDSTLISFGRLLQIFFTVVHDPTEFHRQGNDIGKQYRSAIFYNDDGQRAVAAEYIRKLDVACIFSRPIVTTLEPLEKFYPAEDYHQNYAALNPRQPYIACIAQPKLEKLRAIFPERLRG
jgi:peptide-methionine (S)-S-oxide reductase